MVVGENREFVRLPEADPKIHPVGTEGLETLILRDWFGRPFEAVLLQSVYCDCPACSGWVLQRTYHLTTN